MKRGQSAHTVFLQAVQTNQDQRWRTRNLPKHDPEKWETFKAYCIQDVAVERDIRKLLDRYPVQEKEQRLWALDQHINDRGVGLDIHFVKKAMECDEGYSRRLEEAARELTGLDNPNSPTQLKKWLSEHTGQPVTSLTKDDVPKLIKEAKTEEVKEMLELRQLMAKTSIKKYETMQNAYCRDTRAHGLLQFYGANRTGRWAGRLIQVQNLPQNHLPDLDEARNLVRSGKFDQVEFLYDSISDTLSQLIRTAFIPREGNRFMVADFSAIEARVIAWMAGEQWRLGVFKTHGKIYEASAAQMFKVPIESVEKGSEPQAEGENSRACLYSGKSISAYR